MAEELKGEVELTSILVALIGSILIGMIPRAVPILFAALGEDIGQTAGVLNLGVEGMLLMGAIIGFVVDFETGNIWLAFAAAGMVGMLFSLFHAVVSISITADEVVSGTALWFIGWGLSGVIYAAMLGSKALARSGVPHVSVVEPILFGLDPLFYVVIGALVGIQFFLYHTKVGLNLRAVGESPQIAEIMGVNPLAYRYGAVLFGGLMAGLGGAYLTLAVVGSFYYNMTAGLGFIAVALVYFGKWRPWRVFIGCLIFGAVYVLYLSLESVFPSVPYQFFAMWPYLATLLVILVIGPKAHAPSSLTLPYRKEG